MKILDKYIGGRFLITFFFIILLLLSISIVIDITENVDNFIEMKVPTKAIVNYYLDFIPWIMSLLAPLFIFISVIFFTSRLTNNSEIIATISGGVSFYRLLVPYLVSASIVAVLFFFSNHYLLPKSNADIVAFKTGDLGKKETLSDPRNIHISLNKENKILYLKTYNKKAGKGFYLSIDEFDGNDIIHRTTARNIEYIDSTKTWLGKDVTERVLTADTETLTRLKEKQLELNVVPEDFYYIKHQWSTLTTPELNKQMAKEKEKGSAYVNFYEVEKHKRTATPVSILIFTIMGVAIASRKVRGGTGIHLAVGILMSAVYVVLLNFSETFAQNAGTSPVVSVWLPNIVFGFIAIYLVVKAQK